jgi:hypothetical protein
MNGLPVTVTNNVIASNVGQWGEGVDIYGNTTVLNNTIVGNESMGIDTHSGVVLARNNILNGNNGAINTHLTGGTLTADHNLLWANSWDYGNVSPGPGDIAADPQFVNAAAGDYHLRFGSPAMNAGSPTGAPTYDKDGVLRPQMSRFDIGAYEIPGTQVFLPLTAKPLPPATPFYQATFDGPGCDGWAVMDIPIFKVGCLNGEYQVLVKTASQSEWQVANDMAGHPDYDLVADVRFASSVDGMAGLIVDITDNDQFYLFAVKKSGQYGLWAASSSGSHALIPWTSTGQFNPDARNRLMVRRQVGNLGIYLNGQLLWNMLAGRNAGQSIGVYNSATGQPNVDIRWDNFAAYPVGAVP